MCGCNKNKNTEKVKEEFTEDFSLEKSKDMCHYTCSEINTTNMLIFVLVCILIYLLVK